MMSPPAPARAGGAMPELSSYWRITETVTACVASGRILFLDIARDRYLALPAAHNDCFLSWLQSPAHEPPRSCRAMLAELGVGTSAERGMPAECFVAGPTPIDSAYLPRCRVRIGDILSTGRAVLSAWADLRSGRLADAFARRFREESSDSAPVGELLSKLAIFRSARPLVPVRRVCLHDCLALADWLGPRARGITLVLGVSAFPFAAHCWLQAGGAVLDDHPESPSRYQPILHLP